MSRAPDLKSPGGGSTPKRVAAIVGVIALVAAAFFGGLALAHKSSTSSKASSSSSTTDSTGASSSPVAGSSGSTGTTGSNAGNGQPGSQTIRYTGGQVKAKKPATPYAYLGSVPVGDTVQPRTLPVNISLSSTKNLTDGQAIAIHVTPAKGSQIFGYEVRLCAPNAKFVVEYDFYPDQTGNCILQPLSSDSDAHAQVKENPPYTSADLTFRVGEGTSSYTDVYGQKVSITCGKDHPCQLVLLLQVPYGFGFATFPLSFT